MGHSQREPVRQVPPRHVTSDTTQSAYLDLNEQCPWEMISQISASCCCMHNTTTKAHAFQVKLVSYNTAARAAAGLCTPLLQALLEGRLPK